MAALTNRTDYPFGTKLYGKWPEETVTLMKPWIIKKLFKTIATIREKQEQLQKTRSAYKTSTNATDGTRSNMADSKQRDRRVPEWYKQMYDVAGDALVLFLGNVDDYENFTHCKPVPVTKFRAFTPNQSKLQDIRKMIQSAVDTREQKPSDSLSFSLQAQKKFSDSENSQLSKLT